MALRICFESLLAIF